MECLILLALDLRQHGAPCVGGDGEHCGCAVCGIADHDPRRGGPDLYTCSAVGTAVSARAPVDAAGFHSSLAILAITSREARVDKASCCSDRKRSSTRFKITGSSSHTLPSAASSRYTILGCPCLSAIQKAPRSPIWPPVE
jgi:hypothetical protein